MACKEESDFRQTRSFATPRSCVFIQSIYSTIIKHNLREDGKRMWVVSTQEVKGEAVLGGLRYVSSQYGTDEEHLLFVH